MPEHTPLDGHVHHALLTAIIAIGRAPEATDLAATLGVSPAELHASLKRLDANHGVVLHPGTTRVWIVHPFALSPTLNWVAGRGRGWWAPCLWCALGVALLVGEDVEITTRLGAERDELHLHVRDGQLAERGLLVHFAMPPRAAWDNVHHFCASLLPFRGGRELRDWSARHGIGPGMPVPLETLLDLSRHWYGGHLRADWKKHSVAEAQAIFERVGLTGDFWRLASEAGGERF
jgi:hypothetical protein